MELRLPPGSINMRPFFGMRWGGIGLLALAWGVLGASCLPLQDRTPGSSSTKLPTTLAIDVLNPVADITLPQGQALTIKWSGSNLTGRTATVTVTVRASGEADGTIISGGNVYDGVSLNGSTDWDTTDFPGGTYRITAQVENGETTKESTSGGNVILNAPPTFIFTSPLNNVELPTADPNDPNSPTTITIGWTSGDADGGGKSTLKLFLDPDTDHASGNEIEIFDGLIPAESASDSTEFDGTDKDLKQVDAGVYNLFARVDDSVNPARDVESGVQITIPDLGAVPDATAITDPNADTQFLSTDAPHTIKMEFKETDDVLIDLSIDRDDNHQNGNEITILFQRVIKKGTREDTFDWNGKDKDGNVVPDGIYRVFMTVNRGNGQTPALVDAKGNFLRRSDPNEPLISLIAPASDSTVTPGSFFSIQWRDDVVTGTTATVRLTVDDDDLPNEGTETGAPEMEILTGRDATADGVQDTFSYKIPLTLVPGRYTIFAYIDRDGAAPWDNISVSGGHFTIKDPNSP